MMPPGPGDHYGDMGQAWPTFAFQTTKDEMDERKQKREAIKIGVERGVSAARRCAGKDLQTKMARVERRQERKRRLAQKIRDITIQHQQEKAALQRRAQSMRQKRQLLLVGKVKGLRSELRKATSGLERKGRIGGRGPPMLDKQGGALRRATSWSEMRRQGEMIDLRLGIQRSKRLEAVASEATSDMTLPRVLSTESSDGSNPRQRPKTNSHRVRQRKIRM